MLAARSIFKARILPDSWNFAAHGQEGMRISSVLFFHSGFLETLDDLETGWRRENGAAAEEIIKESVWFWAEQQLKLQMRRLQLKGKKELKKWKRPVATHWWSQFRGVIFVLYLLVWYLALSISLISSYCVNSYRIWWQFPTFVSPTTEMLFRSLLPTRRICRYEKSWTIWKLLPSVFHW